MIQSSPNVLIALIAASVLLSGCTLIPRISLPGAEVRGVKDAGEPATIQQSNAESGFKIPAGSTLTITRIDPELDMPKTVIEEWTFSGPSEFRRQNASVAASTGKIDQTVAKARIAEESRKWLVWAGIAFIGIGAILAFNPYLRYPLGGIGLAGTGALLLFAHQNPTLFFIAVGVGALAVGIIMGGELMEKMKRGRTNGTAK